MDNLTQPKTGFVAGTLIHTDKGLVPIQDIKVGDMVLSKPEDGSGQAEYKPVLSTFKSTEKRDIFAVSYHHKTGLNYLLCTANHPFWVSKQPNAYKGEWIVAEKLPPGCLYSYRGDEIYLDDYNFMPLRTLPHFPDDGAYTHRIEEQDSWLYEGSTYDVMYLQLTNEDYHFISLSSDEDQRSAIRENYCELRAKDPIEFIGVEDDILINPEFFKLLDVLLEQDISPFYRSKKIYLDKMHSPFIMNGNIVKEDHIFDEDGFKKALHRLEKYGVNLGADYGDSVHLSMHRYNDDCPNPYKAYVYNLEVADHHTYFVGHDAVWVH